MDDTSNSSLLENRSRQLHIVHLSDVHLGASNRFRPPVAPGGDVPPDPTFPKLSAKLLEDLSGPDPGCPVIICITGDITDTGALDEFKEARAFIHELSEAPILGRKRPISCFFVVAGNHDVKYDEIDVENRWQQWIHFHDSTFHSHGPSRDPWDLIRLVDAVDEHGTFVLCLNSAIYVRKGSPDEDRGRIDTRQFELIEQQLETVDSRHLDSAIRVALIHHHPILIPQLAEARRGYDAVHGSRALLTVLRKYGFHMILHGHKHYPCTFTDDTNSGFAGEKQAGNPLLIVAGGSLSSSELPDHRGSRNCYNRISVNWHSGARQTRIRVETHGLNTSFDDGSTRPANRWQWQRLSADDRHFIGGHPLPSSKAIQAFDQQPDDIQQHEGITWSKRNIAEAWDGISWI